MGKEPMKLILPKKHLFAKTFLAILAGLLSNPLPAGDTVEGIPTIIDGDTLLIGMPFPFFSDFSTEVQLFGIDAPEAMQICYKEVSERSFFGFKKDFLQGWECGETATYYLYEAIVRNFGLDPEEDLSLLNTRVHCEGSRYDERGRLLARCWAEDMELNRYMVAQGWALAARNSDEYREEESRAKESKLGIWSSEFVMPWKWREGERLDVVPIEE